MKKNVNKFVYEVVMFDCLNAHFVSVFDTYQQAFNFVREIYRSSGNLLSIRKIKICCCYEFTSFCRGGK